MTDTLHEGLHNFMTVAVIILQVLADAEETFCIIKRLCCLWDTSWGWGKSWALSIYNDRLLVSELSILNFSAYDIGILMCCRSVINKRSKLIASLYSVYSIHQIHSINYIYKCYRHISDMFRNKCTIFREPKCQLKPFVSDSYYLQGFAVCSNSVVDFDCLWKV